MIATISSGISNQLRDIYSICRCCWNVATYKLKIHNGKIEIFTFHYIDNVLSLNNSKFRDFFYRIYPIELEIKDITDADMSDSYLDIDLTFNLTIRNPWFSSFLVSSNTLSRKP
jgi:hypothetical protein